MLYFIEQLLNGVQLGMLLFLLAAGLTLIFGIMDLVNLAHGSLYMLGAYFAATFAALTGQFRARRHPGAGRDLRLRRGARSDRDPAALRPQPSRSRARHVRAVAVLQRIGAAGLGPGRHDAVAAERNADCRADHSRRVLSGLSAGHHRCHLGGRGAALHPGDAHAARHADPRRRLEPRNGRRARRQHQAALHSWCSASAPRWRASPA